MSCGIISGFIHRASDAGTFIKAESPKAEEARQPDAAPSVRGEVEWQGERGRHEPRSRKEQSTCAGTISIFSGKLHILLAWREKGRIIMIIV